MTERENALFAAAMQPGGGLAPFRYPAFKAIWIANLASNLGINATMLLPLLASLLPTIIDKMTPNGQAPANGLGPQDDLLASLSNMLQKG